jgi:hypothetical protein
MIPFGERKRTGGIEENHDNSVTITGVLATPEYKTEALQPKLQK